MKNRINKEFLIEHKKEVIRYSIAVIAVIVLISCYLISEGNKKEMIENTGSETETEEAAVTGDVIVDICGAVINEQVVTLPSGSRIEDAIEEAGGLAEDADLTDINRAQILIDGEKIYIPYKGDDKSDKKDNKKESETGIDESGMVNINVATSDELQTLTGIGPVTAEKIIAWRTEYGKFEKAEDLMEVNGIGEKTFAQLKDKIKV